VGTPLPQLRRRPPADRHRRAGASSGSGPVPPGTERALPLRGGRLPTRSTTRNPGLRRRPGWVREEFAVRHLRAGGVQPDKLAVPCRVRLRRLPEPSVEPVFTTTGLPGTYILRALYVYPK
jgi:hypothetical protein